MRNEERSSNALVVTSPSHRRATSRSTSRPYTTRSGRTSASNAAGRSERGTIWYRTSTPCTRKNVRTRVSIAINSLRNAPTSHGTSTTCTEKGSERGNAAGDSAPIVMTSCAHWYSDIVWLDDYFLTCARSA